METTEYLLPSDRRSLYKSGFAVQTTGAASDNKLENQTIGGFANAAKVNEETCRFYQRKGL
mgnify:FL=1|jgi:hypothetical protein|tara:strand:- start:579 stop:761 length:183 start_codon:yes stop_codon:yes gene_type:complete